MLEVLIGSHNWKSSYLLSLPLAIPSLTYIWDSFMWDSNATLFLSSHLLSLERITYILGLKFYKFKLLGNLGVQQLRYHFINIFMALIQGFFGLSFSSWIYLWEDIEFTLLLVNLKPGPWQGSLSEADVREANMDFSFHACWRSSSWSNCRCCGEGTSRWGKAVFVVDYLSLSERSGKVQIFGDYGPQWCNVWDKIVNVRVQLSFFCLIIKMDHYDVHHRVFIAYPHQVNWIEE